MGAESRCPLAKWAQFSCSARASPPITQACSVSARRCWYYRVPPLRFFIPLPRPKNVKFLDIGLKFLDENGHLSKEIMPDTTHPSAKGHEIWARATCRTPTPPFSCRVL